MKKSCLLLILFFCSSVYASEQPYSIDYELKNNPQPDSTHTKSFTTVLLPNNSVEIPGHKENDQIGSIEILLTTISENEVLVSNTFTIEGKEYKPEMTVVLGEEASFTAENISLAITVAPYVPEVVN